MQSSFNLGNFPSLSIGRRDDKGLNGLKNLGNTCFMNVVLQSLASISAFHLWLYQNYPNQGQGLGYKLRDTILDLCIRSKGSLVPAVSTVDELKKKFLNLEQQDAHELMQFLLTTAIEEADTQPMAPNIKSILSTSTLKELRIQPKNNSITLSKRNPFYGVLKNAMQCVSCRRVSMPTYQKFLDLSLSIPDPKKHRAFTLEDCLKYFTEPELVHDVDCSTWSSNDTRLNGAKKCPRNVAQKKLSIVRAPKTLCLHLRRLVGAAYGFVKLNCHIKFPLELDLSPYCSFNCDPAELTNEKSTATYNKTSIPQSCTSRSTAGSPFIQNIIGGDHTFYSHNGQGNSHTCDCMEDNPMKGFLGNSKHKDEKLSNQPKFIYRLVSVVVHHGSHYGGHYTVYRKLFTGDMFSSVKEYNEYLSEVISSPSCNKRQQNKGGKEEWYHISDEHISRVPVEDVLRSQAYMLYYERIE